MARRILSLRAMVLVATCVAKLAESAATAQASTPEEAMSEDVGRMHERLVALSRGESSIAGLRIELMHGSSLAHRSITIQSGTLVSKEWHSPGSTMIHKVGRVSDARLIRLLTQLIDERYWTFQGTRFVPDASVFLFRFFYDDLTPVDFLCDTEEIRGSSSRGEIRDLLLKFVSETDLRNVALEKDSDLR